MGRSGSKVVAPEKEVIIEQWRYINWRNTQDDLQYMRNFTPQGEGQLIRILLHGPPGAGKSSFINSVQSVLCGRIYRQALAADNSTDSFTSKYTTFRIPKELKSFYPFVFNDTMGMSKTGGVLEEDLKLALKGHVKEGYRFNPKSKLSEHEEFYNKSPKPSDKVHVLVCVIPADTLSVMDDEVVKKIRRIRHEASQLMIPQFVIVTKIDVAHPEVKQDVKNVYKLKSVKDQMKKLSADVGIPMNCIFPMKNYHEEINMDENMNSLILNAIRNMINAGDDFIKFNQTQTESS